MALRNIVLDGDDILNKKSREVVNFDHRLATLIDDMVETMRHSNGLGLAAVQVGVLRRIAVVEVGDTLLELINPRIIHASPETICRTEGCLSFPDEQGIVERPKAVTVTAQNRDGNQFEFSGEDMIARAICHELDHLDGIVFLSKALSDEELESLLEERGDEIWGDDDNFDEDSLDDDDSLGDDSLGDDSLGDDSLGDDSLGDDSLEDLDETLIFPHK